MNYMRRLTEVYGNEIYDFYLRNNTPAGVYLVFFHPNINCACAELEKRLGFQVTADDTLELCLLRYDSYKEALQAFSMINDLGVAPEIWVNGRRKKRNKINS